ncbi:homeobox-domain-containing protein [Cubamyces lactineus]|nr:homeobox-domain-containing protein [Cubamyces lactineus]
MSNQQHPEDHFHYGCFPRPNRRGTPTGGNNNNNNANNNNGSRRGLFHLGQGGRTVLPPLFAPFRTSRSPVPDPAHQFPQQDPLQARSDPNIAPYGQPGWPVNPSQTHQQGVPFSSDPRYQGQTTYGSYPSRSSPSMIGNPQESRTLPPLNMPQSQMHPHIPMTAPPQVRSPTGGYQTYPPFTQQHQQPNPYGYPAPPDPRQLPPSIPTMPPFDQPSGLHQRRGSLVDRSGPLRTSIGHGASPYPRVPSVVPPSTYNPEPQPEPVKKKRKRADAEQLKVLNETYNRTAFPSTEERIELAKKLGMSARSVQIWFQNKRQAMRQSSRQAAASAPPTTSQPYPAPSHTPVSASLPPSGAYTGHPSATMGASSISQAGYSTPRPPSEMGGMHHASGRLNPSPSPSSHRRSHEEEQHRHGRFSPRPGY